MKFLLVEIKDQNGNMIASTTVEEKHFSTGSDGFYASLKVTDPFEPQGTKLQTNLQFIKIGSKEKNKAAEAMAAAASA